MATLKELLDTTLESHLESRKEWISKQGSIGNLIKIVPYPGTTGAFDINYTPPADGWVCVDDVTSAVDLFCQGAMIAYSGKAGQTCRRAIICPVQKGGICHIKGETTGSVYIIFRPCKGQA